MSLRKKIGSKVRAIIFGKTEKEKAEEMLELYMKHIPKLRRIMNEGSGQTGDTDNARIEAEMYDFFQDWDAEFTERNEAWMRDGETRVEKEDTRKAVTPVSVVKELEALPTPLAVEGLDEKIKLFKDKSKLTNQRYTKDQIEGFIKRLEYRKRYKEFHSFYDRFPITTDEKIDELLAKYKLVMKRSDLFVPTFPSEAIEVMKEYTETTKLITPEKPVFYVIAEARDFKKKVRKLDPILLVQSPFGFFWQILGAWDKEMLLLHEL